ncbi:hypothetical protein NDA14_003221 [Ustilago hordei]|nr:hypothetical protein NDA14_003221 [Ustilago hordei]
MASSSASRPSRPSENPSRHSISATSGFRLKDAHAPLRSHPHAPARAKLRHAVPPSKTMAESDDSPHVCHNCHQMHTRFFCDPCLTSRIEAHHDEMRRLSQARDKAKLFVTTLLFDSIQDDAVANLGAASRPTSPPRIARHDTLPDPFETNAAEPTSSQVSPQQHLLPRSLIQLRAQRATILSRVQEIHKCISESQHTHLHAKELLKEKHAHLALRKQNLAKAWSSLEGSSAAASISAAQRSRNAAKSRWLTHPAADHIDAQLVYTDVYSHYERQSDQSGPSDTWTPDSTDHQLGATLTRARLELASLQAEGAVFSTQLAATRAALARQAFRLFSVTSPDMIASKHTSSSKPRQVDLSASSSVAQRISKLSERYIPGAFGLGHMNASHHRHPKCDSAAAPSQRGSSTCSASPSLSSSNWSIVSLPLPLPSEARRYPRDTVNGAVTYAANLLQLLAGYLGVSLPFAIEQHKGRLAIRPDPLWDGGGGSSAKTLYLSSSAYTHLTASQPNQARPSKLNNLAESTFGLGASTLSTIESYIHLPSGTGLPWGLTSNTASSAKSGWNADVQSEQSYRDTQGSLASSGFATSSSSSSRSKPDQAAKSFVSALVMFSYNVGYLASKQGIKLDLVAAAANPLSLLDQIIEQPELGRLAHANHIRASSIQDLSLPSLDYEQLAQILEPSNAAAEGYKPGVSRSGRSHSSRNAVALGQTNSKSAKVAKILEQSYVDVGQAAASMLDIKDPSFVARKADRHATSGRNSLPKSESGQDAMPKQSGGNEAISSLQKHHTGGADRRSQPNPTAHAPPSLDFLRQRGRDATKAKTTTPSEDVGESKREVQEDPPRSAQTTPTRVGPGAVIFNGVEVGVGNLDPTERSQSRAIDRKSRKQFAEEGWDLV